MHPLLYRVKLIVHLEGGLLFMMEPGCTSLVMLSCHYLAALCISPDEEPCTVTSSANIMTLPCQTVSIQSDVQPLTTTGDVFLTQTNKITDVSLDWSKRSKAAGHEGSVTLWPPSLTSLSLWGLGWSIWWQRHAEKSWRETAEGPPASNVAAKNLL